MATNGPLTGQEFSALSASRGTTPSPCSKSQWSQAMPVKAGKKTRFEVIHDLLESQGDAQPETHHLRLDKAYLRCTQCRGYGLEKRSSPASWVKYVTVDRWQQTFRTAIQLWSVSATWLNVGGAMPGATSTEARCSSRRSSATLARSSTPTTLGRCWHESS